MKRLILASHGSLAKGMKSAIKMIVVDDSRIEDYNLDDYNTPFEIKKEIEKQMNEKPDDEFLIITDVKGGSVFNELVKLCAYENVVLISVMSLPLVLEMNMSLNSTKSFKELADTIMPLAQKTCEILDHQKIKAFLDEQEDTFS